jgi:hypothetical protein
VLPDSLKKEIFLLTNPLTAITMHAT